MKPWEKKKNNKPETATLKCNAQEISKAKPEQKKRMSFSRVKPLKKCSVQNLREKKNRKNDKQVQNTISFAEIQKKEKKNKNS